MKTPSIEILRGLVLAVLRDVIATWAPGILRSRAYARDLKFLATASELELLQELPVVGKTLDTLLCEGREDIFGLADSGTLTPVQARRFPYLLDGVRQHDADAIRAFRQIHHLYAKLELGVASDDAITAFVERQNSLPTSIPRTPLVICARHLTDRILSLLPWRDIIPRHGPGALATGEKPWEKMHFRRRFLDMDSLYPFDEFFFLNASHLSDVITGEGIPCVDVAVSHCKLVAVPKDFRGPRIIAMEALEKQWIQQGQRRILVRRLESHPLTRGYVNFASQDVNRRLALRSSQDGLYSTLDLKDASDRVSVALVDSIIGMPANEFLHASRSCSVVLPSGDTLPLRSFSPMGSAVCFPLESLIFYALSLSAVYLNSSPTTLWPPDREIKKLLGTVYVYGDDLVVRHDHAVAVAGALESVGLVVNRNKCCFTGRFRESCGVDAYNGQEIQPVRVKHLPSRSTPSSFPSSCSYLNMFRQRGMMNSHDFLMKEVMNTFGTVPFLTCHSDPCGIFTTSLTEAVEWNNSHFKSRFNKQLFRPEWLVTQVTPRFLKCAIPGWSQLLRILTAYPYGRPDDWSKDDDEWSIPHALTRNQRWRSL